MKDIVELQPNVVGLLPVTHLRPDPQQPRTEFDPVALQALAADISERGIEHPIVVRPDPAAAGAYLIKDGERRWRAAQLAKVSHVRCLLAQPIPTDPAQTAAVELLLDQAADNDHAEKLGPLDWARLCVRLVEEHGLAVKDVPPLLAKRGITLSRPYVSNLMRLLELPDWAQELIKHGKLTPRHGMALFPATASPAVLAALRDRIEKWDENEDGALTVEEMAGQVFLAFDDQHLNLETTYGARAPKFDIKTCEGCPHRRPIKGKWRDGTFCLNEPCFHEKQNAAARAKDLETKTPDKKTAAPAAKEREKAQRDVKAAELKRRAGELADRRAVVQLLAAVGKTAKLTAEDLRDWLREKLMGDMADEDMQAFCAQHGLKKSASPFEALSKEFKKCNDLPKLQAYAIGLSILESANGPYYLDAPGLDQFGKRFGVDIAKLRREALAELTAQEAKAAKPEPAKQSAAAKTKEKIKPKKKGAKK